MNLPMKFLAPFLLLITSASLHAQGFYVRGDAGIAMMNDFVASNEVGSPPLNPGQTGLSQANVNLDDSFQWQAGVGYEFDDFWRIDLTGGQSTKFPLEGACIPSNVCPPVEVIFGNLSSTQVFLNGYLELATLLFGEQRWFHPYIGVGLGYAHNKVSKIEAETRSGMPISSVESNAQGNFAWRATGGLAFEITEQLFLDFSYSYMDAGSLQAGETVNVHVPNAHFTFDLLEPFSTEMVIQEVTLGLRVQF